MNDNHTTCQYMGPDQHTITCSHPVKPGFSYCEHHWPRVYQEGTALRRRHKDIRRANTIRDIESLLDEAIAELESEGAL